MSLPEGDDLRTPAGAGRRVLEAAGSLLGHAYAQWVIEDPRSFAYRVAAERLPEGRQGYATAHRLGVIGQVFRSARAIFVADTRAHPLYDPYDPEMAWELALPVSTRAGVAVLNFEGPPPAPALDALWERLARAVRDAVDGELPPAPPGAGEAALKATAWVSVAAPSDAFAAAAGLARLAAGARCWALIVAPAPHAPSDGIEDALTGVAPCLDRLEAPSLARPLPEAWRARLQGRYDYVVSPRGLDDGQAMAAPD